MDKSTIKNINILLLAFAMYGIWEWLVRIPTDPTAIYRLLLVFLTLITLDRFEEVENGRKLR